MRAIFNNAGQISGISAFEAYLAGLRKTLGPPWNQDHRSALAAVIAAAAEQETSAVLKVPVTRAPKAKTPSPTAAPCPARGDGRPKKK